MAGNDELSSRRPTGGPARPPLGRPAGATQMLRIVGFGTGGKTFTCKAFDSTGAVVGEDITVFARSYPQAADGRIGQQDLRNCYPNFLVGDDMRIERLSIWDGASDGGAYLNELWAERGGPFVLGC